jgi:hypothetical protein
VPIAPNNAALGEHLLYFVIGDLEYDKVCQLLRQTLYKGYTRINFYAGMVFMLAITPY